MRFLTPEQMNAESRHFQCAATGRTTDAEGMFDWRREFEIHDFRTNSNVPTEMGTAISAVAVKEMARELGWYPPDKVAEIEVMLAEYAAKVASLEAYVEKLEQFKALEAELTEVAA